MPDSIPQIRPIRILLLLFALLSASLRVGAEGEVPVDSGFREAVQVDLVQVEVTVWPEDGEDAGECLGLAADDFELTVNGRARRIAALDWLGSQELMQLIEEAPVEDPANPPLTLVLFFDLWHLNIFYRDFDCPVTRPLAIEQARELIREQFRPGDRLLLVTFAGWPQIHEGWIRDPEHALRALDRLEVSPFVLNARRDHLHHREWIAGVKSLFLALGRYPGRKEVFYLGDDFRFDDVALQTFDLAARAQANQVSVHAVDLLAACRSMPGPGCPGLTGGGLGCTPFADPVALGYVSVNTGGTLFDDGRTLATAVETVRRMRGCRYLISFPMFRKDGKRAPKTAVRLKRKDLALHFPSSFGNPRREPTERERQDALFLLPRFGRGIDAEIGLWPLRPTGRKKRWNGVMIARLRKAHGEQLPPGLERIEIEAVAHTGSRVYGEFRKVVEGEELTRLREGESRLLVFPVQGIRPGFNTISLRAVGAGAEISANVRSWLQVPEPPGPGRAGPWLLADRLARIGDRVTVMPALDGVLREGRGGLLLAFGCRNGEGMPGEGRLVSPDGEGEIRVSLEWMDGETCGWLAGTIEPQHLAPGLWRFEPPASLNGEGESVSAVEFRIPE